MASRYTRFTLSLCLLFVLQACSSAAVKEATDETANTQAITEPDPELTLNLPQPPDFDSVCHDDVNRTYFDRGFSALAAGDHVEAVTYFQRYQRTESSTLADWEAEVAIAYDSILPQSPFYDPQAARKSWRRLKDEQPQQGEFNEKALMMRDALAAFYTMQQSIRELRSDNARLVEDIAKREEALRRLRELTLGQKGAAP